MAGFSLAEPLLVASSLLLSLLPLAAVFLPAGDFPLEACLVVVVVGGVVLFLPAIFVGSEFLWLCIFYFL